MLLSSLSQFRYIEDGTYLLSPFDDGFLKLYPATPRDSGFMVSLEVPAMVSRGGFETVAAFVVGAAIAPDSPFYVGMWTDGSTRYLDASLWIEDREQALKFAREQSQLAIWDCANGCEVRA